MMTEKSILTCVVLLCTLAGCSGEKGDQKTDLVTFPLKGEVVAVDTSKLRITIAHEEIPDFMARMTMPFRVKDPALLEGIIPGDSVTGTLAVSRTESWLATLSVSGSGAVPDVLDADGVNLQRLIKPGDRLPDLTFLNQDGESVSLNSYQGKVVALTFIYSRCPLPEFCIRMSDYFSRIQKALKKDAAHGNWQLLTFSFDPVFDKPGVLKEYGRNYGADFSRWHFLTDPDTSGRTVLALANLFDLTYQDDEGALISHNLRTAIVDADGRLVEIIKDNEWKPEDVAERIRGLSAGYQ